MKIKTRRDTGMIEAFILNRIKLTKKGQNDVPELVGSRVYLPVFIVVPNTNALAVNLSRGFNED